MFSFIKKKYIFEVKTKVTSDKPIQNVVGWVC